MFEDDGEEMPIDISYIHRNNQSDTLLLIDVNNLLAYLIRQAVRPDPLAFCNPACIKLCMRYNIQYKTRNKTDVEPQQGKKREGVAHTLDFEVGGTVKDPPTCTPAST